MKLIGKAEAIDSLAMLAKSGTLLVEITEDITFRHDDEMKWISLGEVNFFPDESQENNGPSFDYRAAIRHGAFEWKLPDATALENEVSEVCDICKIMDDHKDKLLHYVREGIQDILRRTLIQYPVFDTDTMGILPLQRPVTIVPDTSAIHQGALDFMCRFLMPWARIKIPAIVHMEIINQAENYFKIRFGAESEKKKPAKRCSALRYHLLSQGGQRTLLRMEFNPEVELDRGDLGADPLRGIVTPSSDPEDKNLNLQHIVRSFADRLVLETARRFQFQIRPDHPLFLLTSDQGLARMAMAEGLGVMFFQARAVPQFENQTATGALFAPFLAEIHTVSFVDILWELAVSFGRARIRADSEPNAKLEVWGIVGENEGVTWQPLHAREDLLWAKIDFPEPTVYHQPSSPTPDFPPRPIEAEPSLHVHTGRTRPEDLKSSYRFSPEKLLALVGNLVQVDQMTATEAQESIDVRSSDTFRKYVRFLASGRLIQEEGIQLRTTNKLVDLWEALSADEDLKAAEILRAVPSFNALWEFVEAKGIVDTNDLALPTVPTARSNYFTLGEALRAWVRIMDRGVVYTPVIPDCGRFAETAISAYSEISHSDGVEWVLTGKWLEKLAVEYGIHPMTTRKLTAKCKQDRFMRIFAEGSTPDNRFDGHTFWTLSTRGSTPCLERSYFYRGDFLLPGTAAVRVKIEMTDYAS